MKTARLTVTLDLELDDEVDLNELDDAARGVFGQEVSTGGSFDGVESGAVRTVRVETMLQVKEE